MTEVIIYNFICFLTIFFLFQNESDDNPLDLEQDINDIYYVLEDNIISSLYKFKVYLKHLLFIYVFGGNYEDQCDYTVADKMFDSFNKNARNKVLKNLLNNSIKKDLSLFSLETCCDKYEVRIEYSNPKAPAKEIMMLSLRTLIEISTVPLTKDFRKPRSK